AVVGAGSTGSSVAYHLARAGHPVTLLEMGQVGGGMTSRSTANVRTHYSNETLARMALYSLGALRGVEGAGFVRSGMLFLVSEEYWPAARETVAMLRRVGVTEDVLERTDAARLFPEVDAAGVDHFVLEPESGYADPVSTAGAYASMAGSLGARVLTNARVDRLESSGGSTSLFLGDGRILDFPRVVLCTNVWTNGLLSRSGLARGELPPLRTVPHPVVVYRRPEAYHGVRVIVSDYPKKAYYKPEGRSLLYGGSIDAELDRVTIEPEDCPSEVPDEYVVAYSQAMMERIPAMKDATIQRTYYGMYDTTPDELPIVDSLSGLGLPGVYACVGLSGHGFKMCPAFGVMVTEMLDGAPAGPTFDRSPFSLSRFAGAPLAGTSYRGLGSIV
ncbi:MAG: FAD-binding oxidoreductase, partial [Nitrososphaerales archaeon]